MSKRKKLLQVYEKAVEEMKIEMENKLNYHEKNPEKHPFYPDEWKKFWNRRFKELQMEGKDPNTYDFKPEWILSWSKRMQEIHDEEINERTEKLKNKILGNTDMDKSSSESPSRGSPPPPSIKDKKPITDVKNPRHSIQVSEVFEKDSNTTNKPSNDSKARVAGASPINSDSDESISEFNDHNKPREKIKIENPLNVITVLRQLCVLENQLGLLAPKIVDLLSKGLVMEKIEPKSSVKLLTPDNCVTLETVKEKLKGQLLAGVVKKSLVNATMFSIRNIEKLMHLAPKFVPTSSMLHSASTSSPTPVIIPGVGVIDKVAIAQQITQALLAQGKVDVTQDELETLINAVVGMAQSRNNVQGTKNLLASINNGNIFKNATESINKIGEVEKKNLAQLSQGDIINLLKNFKNLNIDEQDGLITYLKDLGQKNPDEVKQLKKYIEMGPSSLKEVLSMFKEEDDDDNYELSEVCKAVKEKVNEQKDEDLNKMTVDFEITEEQKKLLNSLQNYLPEIKSDYSLEPTNSQMQSIPDQLFYKNPINEPSTPYSLDPYSVQKTDPNIYSLQSAPTPFLTTQEQPNNKYNMLLELPTKYSVTQEQSINLNLSQDSPMQLNILHDEHNKHNITQDQPTQYNAPLDQSSNKLLTPKDQSSKYNIPQESLNKYNTTEEQPDEYHSPEKQPNMYNPEEQLDPYSANQVDNYNDPYSQNCSNSYYSGTQHHSYYQYQQNASTSSYNSSGGYYKGNNNAYKSNNMYKGNNTYKSSNTYPETYQGAPKDNDRNKRYNRSQNNRFQSRH